MHEENCRWPQMVPTLSTRQTADDFECTHSPTLRKLSMTLNELIVIHEANCQWPRMSQIWSMMKTMDDWEWTQLCLWEMLPIILNSLIIPSSVTYRIHSTTNIRQYAFHGPVFMVQVYILFHDTQYLVYPDHPEDVQLAAEASPKHSCVYCI